MRRLWVVLAIGSLVWMIALSASAVDGGNHRGQAFQACAGERTAGSLLAKINSVDAGWSIDLSPGTAEEIAVGTPDDDRFNNDGPSDLEALADRLDAVFSQQNASYTRPGTRDDVVELAV